MPRKPTAFVSYKLRIKEALRREIERAAKARGVSLNYEMSSRLERSFERDAQRRLDETESDMSNTWARYGQAFHELEKQGDLLRATEALLKQIEQESTSPAIKAAVVQVKQAIALIDAEAKLLLRRMHTTGQGVDK